MTSSASPARSRAFSAKQLPTRGQRRPAQRSAPTESSDQSVYRRLEVELCAVARLRHRDPVPKALEVGRVLCRPEEPAELVDSLEALAAEVVLAALDDGDPDGAPERRRGGRNVFLQELLLQRLRRRRHDHALAGKERRDEVGEALAGARSRFCHEVVAALERARDLGRERLLLGPRLEAGERAGQPASGSEEGIHGGRRA